MTFVSLLHGSIDHNMSLWTPRGVKEGSDMVRAMDTFVQWVKVSHYVEFRVRKHFSIRTVLSFPYLIHKKKQQ